MIEANMSVSSGATFNVNELKALLFDDSCHHILKDMASNGIIDKELKLIVLQLIEGWCIGLTGIKNTEHYFSHTSDDVTTEKILKAVEILNCGDIFCQILLLLPEKTKRNLIIELCSAFKSGFYPDLREVFLKQSSTKYVRNMMARISQLEKSCIQCFLDNVSIMIKCLSETNMQNLLFTLQFLDNILGNFDVIGTFDESFALLDENGRQRVKDLLAICKSGKITMDKCCGTDIRILVKIESYSCVVMNLFSFLGNSMQDVLIGECSSRDLLFRIILKVNHLFEVLNSKEGEIKHKEELILGVQEFLKKVSSIIASDIHKKFSNIIIDKSVSISKSLYNETVHQLLFSQWKNEENIQKKLIMAACCLDNIYYGHEEILIWLLSLKDLDSEEEKNIFVNHLTAYVINYGTTGLIKRLMHFLLDQKDMIDENHVFHAVQSVVVNCIPYLTVSSCNNLISDCKDCFKPGQSLLWPSTHAKELFHVDLNEVLNKLTSSEIDEVIFHRLCQLSITSPFVVLEELIARIFCGTLNQSVFRNVLLAIPSFYELKLCSEGQECRSSILIYIKSFYKKSRDKRASQSLIGIISVLMNVVPILLKSDFYHNISTFFLFCNLTCEDGFLDINVTLDLMDVMLQYSNITCENFDITLCELLLENIGGIHSTRFPSDVIDIMSNNMHLLVSNVTQKIDTKSIEEKNTVISSIRKMLNKFPWVSSFYFYSLFQSNGYRHQFFVPKSLMKLYSNLDSDIFVPNEDVYSSTVTGEDLTSEDVEKWSCILEICYVSNEASLLLIEHMPAFDADEEMCNLVEAIANTLPPHVNNGKANAIIDYLKNIVQKQKITGIGTWLRDDLCAENDYHPICFSMLVLIQAFEVHYSEIEESVICKKHSEIQNYMKLFHLLLIFVKDVIDVKIRSSILLYMLEQLIFNVSTLGGFITNSLSLVLMDIVIAILACVRSVTEEFSKQILDECHEVIDRLDGDLRYLLIEKLKAGVKI